MGSGEGEASAKSPKPLAGQEQSPTTSSAAAVSVYPDWSNFQACPPIPPHGLFPSPVPSSPQAYPYMWGAPHLMPPYGTPLPPYLTYPPRGLYSHPSVPPGLRPFGPFAMSTTNMNAENSGVVPSSMEMDGKSCKGKEKGPTKRSKGGCSSSNMISEKNNSETCKSSGPPANEVSQRCIIPGDSTSDSSSEEESDGTSQNDSQPKTSGGGESFDDQAPSQAMMSHTRAVMPMPAASAPGGVVGPATNLNIGMEYWAASSLSHIPSIHGKMPTTAVGGAVAPSVPSKHWLQDERERKRQRRKQSNREAARRSRMRKQAEFEELANRAETLNEENTSLRTELNRIKSEYEHLLSENNSLKEKLGEVQKETQEPGFERNDQPLGKENPK
ncbi:unnamed protein product [Musa hybrid cultivar]